MMTGGTDACDMMSSMAVITRLFRYSSPAVYPSETARRSPAIPARYARRVRALRVRRRGRRRWVDAARGRGRTETSVDPACTLATWEMQSSAVLIETLSRSAMKRGAASAMSLPSTVGPNRFNSKSSIGLPSTEDVSASHSFRFPARRGRSDDVSVSAEGIERGIVVDGQAADPVRLRYRGYQPRAASAAATPSSARCTCSSSGCPEKH